MKRFTLSALCALYAFSVQAQQPNTSYSILCIIVVCSLFAFLRYCLRQSFICQKKLQQSKKASADDLVVTDSNIRYYIF